MRFNPPPGWPTPPEGWTPPAGWKPDPAWPAAPPGWQLFIPDDESASVGAGKSPTKSAQEAPGNRSAPPATTLPTQPAHQGVDPAALLSRIAELEAALTAAQPGTDAIDLSDQHTLQDVGIYRYHHPLENAAAYKSRLRSLEGQIDSAIRNHQAILAADMFTFNGSLAQGRKLVGDLSKLMLRAYNAEADNCVRSLRSGNVRTAQKRLESAVTAIERLGVIMEMRINPEYHALRVAEIELTADFQMKMQEEREQTRQERQLLREQRRAEQELAAERQRLEKERAHYLTALATLRAQGDDSAVTELSGRLADIEKAIAANDYRIANIRAGYVYVISNIGAFGPNIIKIGMTRRLDPMDRVRELGDASVPFRYDVHALFFSEDAVALESELHKAFTDRRVNFVNQRREFFFATPSEVRALLADRVGGLLEFTEEPTALEYFQSRSRWPEQS
ncbi:DUF4041 domain-containing protein [Streptomyces seoulensis]|uniref:DUF4041 domain-containing protein n=1 Tax=Streptomyces seoulensis TaxID=73044 RepID=UPI003C2C5016